MINSSRANNGLGDNVSSERHSIRVSKVNLKDIASLNLSLVVLLSLTVEITNSHSRFWLLLAKTFFGGHDALLTAGTWSDEYIVNIKNLHMK